MARTNRTTFAVLGMLAQEPRSGYDLKRDFEQSVRHFWSESVGQIYPTLHRLRDEGLVRARHQAQQGRPDRMVYSITRAGRDVLRAWLSEPPEPDRVRNELLLKVFFGPQMGGAQAQEHIRGYMQMLRDRLELYAGFDDEIERVAETPEQAMYSKLTLRSGQAVTEARLEWCRTAIRTIRRFEQRAGTAPIAAERTA